jgi:hypothetical protein
MPRFRNETTGVVVSVPEEKGARLAGYVRLDEVQPDPAPEPKRRGSRRQSN